MKKHELSIYGLMELNHDELMYVNGGSFWDVFAGVVSVIAGAAIIAATGGLGAGLLLEGAIAGFGVTDGFTGITGETQTLGINGKYLTNNSFVIF